MKTIYRYEINREVNDLSLPQDFKILSVGVVKDPKTDKEKINMWAEVDDYRTSPKVPVKIVIFGTGADLSSLENFSHQFIGTVQKSNQYAYHVFLVTE